MASQNSFIISPHAISSWRVEDASTPTSQKPIASKFKQVKPSGWNHHGKQRNCRISW